MYQIQETCFVQFTNKIYKLNTTAITYSDIQNLVVKYQLYSNTTDTLSLNYARIRINYNKYYPENVISIYLSGGTGKMVIFMLDKKQM